MLAVSLQGVGTLQQVEVPIIDQTSCQNMFQIQPSEDVTITNDMICAGYQEGGKDSCQVKCVHALVCVLIYQLIYLLTTYFSG